MNAPIYPILFSEPLLKRHLVDYQRLSDNDLIRASQQHEQKAIDVLVIRFSRFIHAELFKLAPALKDSSDLEQEVSIRVWRCLGTLKDRSAFKSWLKRIIRNVFLDDLRKFRYTLSLDEPVQTDDGDQVQREIPDESLAPDLLAEGREMSLMIENAFDTLPQSFRKALLLREYAGFSYEDISKATKTEIGTVKSRVHRARQKMQVQLSPIYGSEVSSCLAERELLVTAR
jgi:RNA polymerase sigma-70 factor (ECF subfamily)